MNDCAWADGDVALELDILADDRLGVNRKLVSYRCHQNRRRAASHVRLVFSPPCMAPPSPPPPALQEAIKTSTEVWQSDLHTLFLHAKDRFPDVVWELTTDGDDLEDVWGHKAIVYARAPPSFQVRHFSFRPAPPSSPLPYSSSPTGTLPGQSSLSLSLDIPPFSRSPSPFRDMSPTPSIIAGTPLRLRSSINSVLFSNELEYLYTGKGLGQAFEFLFDSSVSREEGDSEENRLDKLRKDLVFMWRSRLYSDVRISLTSNFSSSNHEDTTAIFSSHRFILVSRSPYFLSELSTWNGPGKWTEPRTIDLPSPPFTPASLHFTLGFIYTGTLIFSHRTYDLDTAFHIMRSATYLDLQSLYNEIQARIVQEMMHGLFHAFLEFPEYERITAGKWATGGCRCRQCARRAPRVLEFAIADDVKNKYLDRGARRALVGLFGEGWCMAEFAELPQRTRDSILKGLAKRTTPMNIFPLLFASHHALKKLEKAIDPWADVAREAILSGRRHIDSVLCSKAEECFEQREWLEILENDGVRFDDDDKLKEIMASIRRGVADETAPSVYQVLVSSILIRPHGVDGHATLLSPTSPIRIQVDETRMEIIRGMRKRWMAIRNANGFDNLESWAIQEISHEIEVPVEDLFNPVPVSPAAGRRATKGLSLKLDNASDTTSMHSLRPSTLSRSNAKRSVNASQRDPGLAPSVISTRSKPPSTFSGISRPDVREDEISIDPPSPHSESSSPTSTLPDPLGNAMDTTDTASITTTESAVTKLLISRPKNPKSPPDSRPSSRSVASSSKAGLTSVDRPKSSASSFVSIRSHASTLRNVNQSTGLRPNPGVSRPTSASSTTTDTSTFKTANSDIRSPIRSRRTSAASTISNVSIRVPPPTTPRSSQPRQVSTSSITSLKTKRPAAPTSDPTKLSSVGSRRPSSTVSTRTDISSPPSGSKRLPSRKSLPSDRSSVKSKTDSVYKPTAARHDKIDDTTAADRKSTSTLSSRRTANGTVKRKSSSDTITTTISPDREPREPSTLRGATLDIGIPCVISLKRKRFRAFARYIGEVEGELGPWVGVEVPVSDSLADERSEEMRPWNDGTWGGVRYFEIQGFGSEWDYGDDRAARRRRIERTTGEGLKREGDQLSTEPFKRMRSASPTASDFSNSETRGLFVRPQQVLYVIDAVGSDL